MNTVVILACLVIGVATGYFLCKKEHLKYPVIKWVEKPVEVIKEVPVITEKVNVITKEVPVITEKVKEIEVPKEIIREVIKEIPVEKTLLILLDGDIKVMEPVNTDEVEKVKSKKSKK